VNASKVSHRKKWYLDATFMHLFSLRVGTLLSSDRGFGIFTLNVEHFTVLRTPAFFEME